MVFINISGTLSSQGSILFDFIIEVDVFVGFIQIRNEKFFFNLQR